MVGRPDDRARTGLRELGASVIELRPHAASPDGEPIDLVVAVAPSERDLAVAARAIGTTGDALLLWDGRPPRDLEARLATAGLVAGMALRAWPGRGRVGAWIPDRPTEWIGGRPRGPLRTEPAPTHRPGARRRRVARRGPLVARDDRRHRTTHRHAGSR